YDLANNQLDTLTKAFQATTVACARCHDHKLDAVSMKDYYALLGILRGSRLVSHSIASPEIYAGPRRHLQSLKDAIRQEFGAVWLGEARQVANYLMAAQAKSAGGLDADRLKKWSAAVADNKTPSGIFGAWRVLTSEKPNDFASAWRKLTDRH